MTAHDRAESYGRAALDGLLSELAGAGDHECNVTLYRVAVRAASLAAAGAVEWEHAARKLEAGAIAHGHAPHRIAATLRSAYRDGMANPATLPESEPGHRRRNPTRAAVVRPVPPTSGPPPRPPQGEVAALWDRCCPVLDDPEVAAFLRGRAIPPEPVELFDLARAITQGAKLPSWAGCRRVPWTTSHRLVTCGWGAGGTVESLHARAVGVLPEGLAKGLWPAAGPGSARGLVMADPLARLLLAGEVPTWWSRREVVIAEGLPDFLTWATNYSDADTDAPAVFGVTSGS